MVDPTLAAKEIANKLVNALEAHGAHIKKAATSLGEATEHSQDHVRGLYKVLQEDFDRATTIPFTISPVGSPASTGFSNPMLTMELEEFIINELKPLLKNNPDIHALWQDMDMPNKAMAKNRMGDSLQYAVDMASLQIPRVKKEAEPVIAEAVGHTPVIAPAPAVVKPAAAVKNTGANIEKAATHLSGKQQWLLGSVGAAVVAMGAVMAVRSSQAERVKESQQGAAASLYR